MIRSYLALGSNLGDRAEHLRAAIDGLDRDPDIVVRAVSATYETEPVGPSQPEYLNAVVAVDTDLVPHALLARCQALERAARRVREQHWGPRTLDVDILLYGDAQIDEADLVVPHPRMWERGFVLAPLRDVAPELVERPPQGWSGVRRVSVSLGWTPPPA